MAVEMCLLCKHFRASEVSDYLSKKIRLVEGSKGTIQTGVYGKCHVADDKAVFGGFPCTVFDENGKQMFEKKEQSSS